MKMMVIRSRLTARCSDGKKRRFGEAESEIRMLKKRNLLIL